MAFNQKYFYEKFSQMMNLDQSYGEVWDESKYSEGSNIFRHANYLNIEENFKDDYSNNSDLSMHIKEVEYNKILLENDHLIQENEKEAQKEMQFNFLLADDHSFKEEYEKEAQKEMQFNFLLESDHLFKEEYENEHPKLFETSSECLKNEEPSKSKPIFFIEKKRQREENAKTNSKLANTQLKVEGKKKGRVRKINTSRFHSSLDLDNMRRKIHLHVLKNLGTFCNDIIHFFFQEKGLVANLKFNQLNYKIKEIIKKDLIQKLKNYSIKDILTINFVNTKESNVFETNASTYKCLIQKFEDIKSIFDMKYKDFYKNYYLKNQKHYIYNNRIINLSNFLTFNNLYEKCSEKINNEEYLGKIKYFAENLYFENENKNGLIFNTDN